MTVIQLTQSLPEGPARATQGPGGVNSPPEGPETGPGPAGGRQDLRRPGPQKQEQYIAQENIRYKKGGALNAPPQPFIRDC